MNINYHSWKAFKECPKKFYLEFIKKAPPTIEINEYFTLYGRLVEKFFTLFCNQWRYKTPYMPADFIRHKLKPLYEGVLQSSVVDWSKPFCRLSSEDIFEEAFNDIFAVMESMNQNYFLNTTSEISIEVALNNGHKITGRLDFLHKDPISENIESIIDGKGSTKIGKNVDRNQLIFYALLYFFKFNKLPAELGFFYYKFNTYVPVPLTQDILEKFRAQLSLDIKTIINTEDFIAQPSAKSCKYCKYLHGCNEGMKAKSKRAKKSKIKELEGKNGTVIFGF